MININTFQDALYIESEQLKQFFISPKKNLIKTISHIYFQLFITTHLYMYSGEYKTNKSEDLFFN